ncbi:MAG: flagellar motor protein MotB [Pseudomonadota bacterium]
MSSGPTHRRRHEEPEDEGWLITFADMAVLLMCFFVLLFAMSAPDMKQVQKVGEALREKGFFNDAIPAEDPYEKVKKQLSMSLGASGFDKLVVASESPRGIDVELSSAAFFSVGSAKFTPDALPMLDLIAAQIAPLAKADITIEVEGHTDDSPVASPMFPSNWELSAARASNVVRYLIDKGFPADKLKAIGRGATVPKAPNRDAAGTGIPANQDMNRRIVVRLIKGDDRI